MKTTSLLFALALAFVSAASLQADPDKIYITAPDISRSSNPSPSQIETPPSHSFIKSNATSLQANDGTIEVPKGMATYVAPDLIHHKKTVIHTDNAPEPIGTYSQAIKVGKTIYLSGQIGIDPQTTQLVDGGMEAQLNQVFKNLQAVAQAAGASLDDMTKVTIFTTDVSQFALVNQIMATYFHEPYPARSTVQVAALPKGALIEVEGIIKIVK